MLLITPHTSYKLQKKKISDENVDAFVESIMAKDLENKIEEKALNGNLAKGDYILMKFMGKNSVNYYVVGIMNVLEEGEFKVDFFKCIGTTNTCLKEEIFSCSLDEIQGKLPAPHIQVSCK
jgi:hypothetical protein